MKKTYMTPEMLQHQLQVQQMVAASDPFKFNDGGLLTGGTLQDIDAGDDGLSRSLTDEVWDFEDEAFEP